MKIEVLSHYLFEEKCKEDGLNDENVEDKKGKAFIDIIGTEECRRYYLMEEMQHYFNNFSNVLNLEFDDLSQDVEYDGHIFKAMTMEQAEKTVDFIENMIILPGKKRPHRRFAFSRNTAETAAVIAFLRHCAVHFI